MRSKAGDFVYIHYSGHGDRQPTIYPDVKKGQKYDEVLCTLEEDIRDVEFGDLLDELVDQELAVCVVLDCCFSGGASRVSTQAKTRCRYLSKEDVARVGSGCEPEEDPQTEQRHRNALPVKSGFYRPRGYNLIAACQPHEVAIELMADDGRTYGAMTYHLLQSLLTLQSSTEPVTYGRLQEVLEAKCMSKLKQQPMQIGDRSRIIFGSLTANRPTGSTSLLASVIDADARFVTLNKGSASAIHVGDQFSIYHPSQSFMGLLNKNAVADAKVIVSNVSGLQSKATLPDESPGILEGVKAGWVAQLSKREVGMLVNFVLAEAESPMVNVAVERYQQDRYPHDKSNITLNMRVNAPDPKADLTVRLDQNGSFQFYDKNGKKMPYVPAPQADDAFNMKQMSSLLHHLCSYQQLACISNLAASREPSYEFEILEDEIEEGDNESLAAWRIRFKNLHEHALYVSIFNLGPAYGIHQIFPDDNSSSAVVDPMDEIPHLVIDMKVPQLLARASTEPGFSMRDVIKVFITTQQADFSHYRLPDLQEPVDWDSVDLGTLGPRRNANLMIRREEPWFTDEKEILTCVNPKV